MPPEPTEEEMWREFLTEGEAEHRRFFHLAGLLPSNPRCKVCNAPFKGSGWRADAHDRQAAVEE